MLAQTVSARRLRTAAFVAIAALSSAGCFEDLLGTPSTLPPWIPGSAQLNMAPIAQQTQQWCWAASAEMILRYYQLPNLNPGGDYQCGVVGTYYYLVSGPSHPCVANCFLCQGGASTIWEVQRILNGYGQA